MCVTKTRIRAVRVAEFVVMNHKGKKPWSEQIQSLLPRREDEDEKEGYEKVLNDWKFWVGNYSVPNRRRHSRGSGVSLRRAQTLLMKRIAKLEQQRDREQDGGVLNPSPGTRESTPVAPQRPYSRGTSIEKGRDTKQDNPTLTLPQTRTPTLTLPRRIPT